MEVEEDALPILKHDLEEDVITVDNIDETTHIQILGQLLLGLLEQLYLLLTLLVLLAFLLLATAQAVEHSLLDPLRHLFCFEVESLSID